MARKWGKELKSKIEGKSEDYLPHKSKKTSHKFYFFTPFSNDQVFFPRFFFPVFKHFSVLIKFSSLLAGFIGHPLLNQDSLPARCNYNKPLT